MVIDGVININKPEGMTSHDVVGKVRRKLGIKRVGHTGTLDPMATGVLPICVGKATRAVEYYDADFKTYVASLVFGKRTDTLDITGEVLEECDVPEDIYDRVPDALNSFRGLISQIPPKYSAIRVNGKRLYEYARDGQEVDIKAREVYIRSIEVIGQNPELNSLELEICCSKGTYIRTICDDIGNLIGCGAVMTSLKRTGSGYFSIEDAIDLEAFINMSEEEILQKSVNAEDSLQGYAEIILKPHRIKAFCNGMTTSSNNYYISKEADFDKDPRFCHSDRLKELNKYYKVYSDGLFLGMAEIIEGGELRPVKVIQCR